MSKKDICPLFSVSIVKEIFRSIELRVSWKVETEFFLIMTKLSSTSRFQTFGGVAEAEIADSSIFPGKDLQRRG